MASFRLKLRSTEIDLPFGELTIGRGTDCYIRIDDDLVSRRHAKLVVNAIGVVMEDLGSRNGSSVNGEKVTGRRPLSLGDVIEIGTQTFQLLKGAQNVRSTMTMLPHHACVACGTLIEATRPTCPHCGASQAAAAAAASSPALDAGALAAPNERRRATVPPVATLAEEASGPTVHVGPQRTPSRGPAAVPFAPPAPAVAGAAGGFQLIATLFDKLFTLGRVEEAERMVGPRLRDLLSQAQSQPRSISEAVADGALRRVVRLAVATGQDEWYRYTFDLAAAARLRLDDKLIDELHANMMAHKPAASAAILAYGAVHAGGDAESLQHKKRLDALLRFTRA